MKIMNKKYWPIAFKVFEDELDLCIDIGVGDMA